jgi:hypothetical protein
MIPIGVMSNIIKKRSDIIEMEIEIAESRISNQFKNNLTLA